MLTTTIDGLWVLQVLSRIEVLAPELGLRPYLPSVETARMATDHPVADRLRDVGAINANACVDETLLEWLSVLSRRDSALLIYSQHATSNGGYQRALLARFAQWWVRLERFDDVVRLSDLGIATSEQSADLLISGEIANCFGDTSPAVFRPVTIDVEVMLQTVTDDASLQRFLTDQGADRDQARALASAADSTTSVHASFVALKSAYSCHASRSLVESGVVTVIDTPSGRFVCEHVIRGGRHWMIVSPGSAGDIASAVLKMMHPTERPCK
jgi:hypothetical protein